MMDIRGSHMLLSRNFTSAQNCGELIHYLVVLCFSLHDLTKLQGYYVLKGDSTEINRKTVKKFVNLKGYLKSAEINRKLSEF